MKKIVEWTQSDLENLTHIAYAAGANGHYSGNFTKDLNSYISWAEEFYEKFKEEEDNQWSSGRDWIEVMDDFIENKLEDEPTGAGERDRELRDLLAEASERLEINNCEGEEDFILRKLSKQIYFIDKENREREFYKGWRTAPKRSQDGWRCPECGAVNSPWKDQCDCG